MRGFCDKTMKKTGILDYIKAFNKQYKLNKNVSNICYAYSNYIAHNLATRCMHATHLT